MPGTDPRDELGRLARSLDIIADTGLEAARLKAALESCQTNVMVANRSLEIVYLNPNPKRLMKSIEADVRKDLPQFSSDQLLGSSIDVFRRSPSHQRAILEGLQATNHANDTAQRLIETVSNIQSATDEVKSAASEITLARPTKLRTWLGDGHAPLTLLEVMLAS